MCHWTLLAEAKYMADQGVKDYTQLNLSQAYKLRFNLRSL